MPEPTTVELLAALAAMRAQIEALASQLRLLQGVPADLATILRLVDVNHRYTPREFVPPPRRVATNVQGKRPPPPPKRRGVTLAMAAQAQALFSEGLSTSEVAREVGVSRTVAHELKHGRYPLQRAGEVQ